MKIQLESSTVTDLALNAVREKREIVDNTFTLRTAQHFPEQDKFRFSVQFFVTLHDSEFSLDLTMGFIFKTETEIDEMFKVSDFPKVNAPAIAFPYLRAYISNLTLQSGYEPVILPSINFVELTKTDQI